VTVTPPFSTSSVQYKEFKIRPVSTCLIAVIICRVRMVYLWVFLRRLQSLLRPPMLEQVIQEQLPTLGGRFKYFCANKMEDWR
jgi:hypothetical protein